MTTTNRRLQFSLKQLMIAVSVAVFCLFGWLVYQKYYVVRFHGKVVESVTYKLGMQDNYETATHVTRFYDNELKDFLAFIELQEKCKPFEYELVYYAVPATITFKDGSNCKFHLGYDSDSGEEVLLVDDKESICCKVDFATVKKMLRQLKDNQQQQP